jgi:hypothetical protein
MIGSESGFSSGWRAISARLGALALWGALGALVLLALVPTRAPARAYVPPGNHVFAGLSGGTTVSRFQSLVGKHPPVFETFMTWNTDTRWLARPDSGFRARLALHIGTAPGYGLPGVISPGAVARGASDHFLIALGRNLWRSRRVVYVRLMAEMNGYWNAYAAFARSGASRGPSHSPRAYIAAWRRSVLILRGGRVSLIDRRLRRLGLAPLRASAVGRAAWLPRPRVAFLWVPQDAGSPELPGNSPAAFWPGRAYVDWVGTDFYASYPNFALLDAFYRRFTGKPFVLSEWALYGHDDPGFVRRLFAWVESHRRVRMLNYYQGFSASSPANLARYAASRAVLRAELRSSRFLAYPPEFAHPRRHQRPAPPPLPPAIGVPPTPPSPVGPSSGQLCLKLVQVCLAPGTL